MYIEITNNSREGIDRAIHMFKRKVEKNGILELYKSKQFYMKPSLAKREKRKHGKH